MTVHLQQLKRMQSSKQGIRTEYLCSWQECYALFRTGPSFLRTYPSHIAYSLKLDNGSTFSLGHFKALMSNTLN